MCNKHYLVRNYLSTIERIKIDFEVTNKLYELILSS